MWVKASWLTYSKIHTLHKNIPTVSATLVHDIDKSDYGPTTLILIRNLTDELVSINVCRFKKLREEFCLWMKRTG